MSESVIREFRYKGAPLGDPDPDMSPEDVKKLYAGRNAELTNATIEGPKEEGGVLVYEFVAAVRTKG